MLSKQSRLTKQRVEHILKKGNKKQSRYFIFRYLKSFDDKNHFGILISAKTLKQAVKRNKVRRQIYNLVRTQPFSKKFDILIIVKPSATNLDFTSLKSTLSKDLTLINE